MRSNKEKILIISLVIILTLGYWYALGVFSKKPVGKTYPLKAAATEPIRTTLPEAVATIQPKQTNLAPSHTATAKIIINGTSHIVEIPNTTTLYDALSALANTDDIQIHAVAYPGLGQFIDSINGIKNTSDQYWVYYINEISASVGASGYTLQPNDVIEWKFERSKF